MGQHICAAVQVDGAVGVGAAAAAAGEWDQHCCVLLKPGESMCGAKY